MIAPERHHVYPQCLVRLHDTAQDGLCDWAWVEFVAEAERWGVSIAIPRAELVRLVESTTVLLEREKHRLIHHNDWARWGRRGGLATLRKYGTDHFRRMALRRWALARSAA